MSELELPPFEGFADPEGVVVFHQASNSLFKVTAGGDDHKGQNTRQGG